MRRIFLVLLATCNLTLCQAQEQSSFFQRILEGLFSLITTENIDNQGGIITQDMINQAGRSITLTGAYDMGGSTIELPKGFQLIFKGGSLSNGTLCGNDATIQAEPLEIFAEDVLIAGSWNQPEIHDAWFAMNGEEGHVSNQIIKNILALANDNVKNQINFTTGRTYYFEMPYKGRADLGNLVYSFTDKNGTKQRRYSDLVTDDYDYLRIFTIPSNTSVTLNSTIKMLPTNQGAYYVFWEFGKENIYIEGTGTVMADAMSHLYTDPFAGKFYYGEFGHIFCFQKCHGVSIKGITIDGSFGDGILYRGSILKNEKGQRWASNLTVDHVTVKNARRNGIAVAARNVKITNCHFEGCGSDKIRGTAPYCAVDFEADKISDYPELGNQDVIMDNCTFKDNKLDVASYHNNLNTYGKNATTILNCHFTAPCKLNTTYWMTFKNCRFTSFYDSKSSKSQYLYCRNMVFDTCTFDKIESSCIKNAKNVAVTIRNCKY